MGPDEGAEAVSSVGWVVRMEEGLSEIEESSVPSDGIIRKPRVGGEASDGAGRYGDLVAVVWGQAQVGVKAAPVLADQQ